jgi:pyruvate dehydrogenase E2 component (dihydrolipoamide acetyltransferase)
MATILDMPQLSDTMKIGVMRKWRKNEGEKMSPGEVLAEVETDKATMDFEAFDEGVLLKRLIVDGTSVPVGTPIAIIGKTGEDITALIAEAAARSGGGKPAAKAEAPKAAAPAPKPAPAPAAAPAPAPAPAKAAPAPRPAPAPRAAAPAPAAPAGKVLASPLARKLATDLGIDLRAVQGSGPGGRIVERDVKAVADRGAGAPANDAAEEVSAEAASPAIASAPPVSAAAPVPAQLVPERRAEVRPTTPVPSDDVVKPLSMMRRTIATRLLEAKTTIPHFYLTADVDMDAAMEFREQVAQVHGAKLSVNDLVLKACALVMRRIPEANASFTEEAIIEHAHVHIGMAVAIEDGLITPVIRDADKKTIGQIAGESREMAKRARDRKLKPDEYTGATFSVSNLGMLGVRDFAAIINPPEGGILAVGTVRKEPVVNKEGKIVVGQRMSLTISCDHRVIDGALGAKVLQAIVGILEKPISLAF